MDKQACQQRLQRLLDYLQPDPNNSKLILDICDCYLHLGKIAKAEELLIQHPDDSELQFQLGTLKLMQQQYQNATAIFQKIKQHDISHPGIDYNLAYAYFYNKKYDAAWKALKELNFNEIPQAAILTARVLHFLGNLTQPIEILEKHIIQYKDPEALGLLSIVYLDNEQSEKALKTATQTLEINPNESQAKLVIATLQLDENNNKNAELLFDRILEENPGNGRAFNGRGIAKMFSLNIQGAIDDLTQASYLLPTFLGNYQALGWCQLIRNDIQGAKKTFLYGIELNRNFSENHGCIAIIDIIEGRYSDAELNIKRALGLNKNCFSAQFAQSLFLSQTGNAEQGQAQTQAMLEHIQKEFNKNITGIARIMISKKMVAKND